MAATQLFLNAAGRSQRRLPVVRKRKHPTVEMRFPPKRSRRKGIGARGESESVDDPHDELVATLHELYGRASEVARRILDDARILGVLHGETSELLWRLRALQSERPWPAQLPPPAASPSSDSGPSLPRLISFREVTQRVGLSRSSVWRMERAGQFPRRRQLSVNRVAWWEPEVEEWVRNRQRS